MYCAIVLVGFPLAVPVFVLLYNKSYGGSWPLAIGLSALSWAFVYGIFEKIWHVPWPSPLVRSLFYFSVKEVCVAMRDVLAIKQRMRYTRRRGVVFMEKVVPKLGVKMAPDAAKSYVNSINKKVIQRWDERVTRGAFMSQFLEGKLPLPAIKLFFKNWGNFTVEINTLVACSYHKHIGFFKRHPDLMAPLGAKIADEFMHPKPPGHVLVMLQTAEALGLTKDEILREPMLPEARAILDFKRCLMWEGTVAEWWFAMLTEEPIGHWAASWFKTLTTKYGFSRQQAVYFSTHEEADLKEHDGGVMGHGSFNRLVMQRILEDGYADFREGYNLEYCAMAAVDLYGIMHRAAVELASVENVIVLVKT